MFYSFKNDLDFFRGMDLLGLTDRKVLGFLTSFSSLYQLETWLKLLYSSTSIEECDAASISDFLLLLKCPIASILPAPFWDGLKATQKIKL